MLVYSTLTGLFFLILELIPSNPLRALSRTGHSFALTKETQLEILGVLCEETFLLSATYFRDVFSSYSTVQPGQTGRRCRD